MPDMLSGIVWAATSQWLEQVVNIHPAGTVGQEGLMNRKSLSSLLNIYIRLSGIQSLLRIRYDPDACSHCTKMWHQKMSYPVFVATLQRSARRGFAPIQKSCRNHRSCVWKEALSGMVFVPAKCHPVQGEHSLSPSLRHLSTLGIYSRPRANYTAHDPLSFAIG